MTLVLYSFLHSPLYMYFCKGIYIEFVLNYLRGTLTNRGFNDSGTWNDLERGAVLPFSYHSACIFPSSLAGCIGS